MTTHSNPVAVAVQVRLHATERGGRTLPVEGRGGYRPHLRVKDGALLGTGFYFNDPVVPGHEGEAVALLPFDVDYSVLTKGVEASLFEGPHEVGVVEVAEAWYTAVKLIHETHTLGVAVVRLEDDGMGLWGGPFLAWPAYARVRHLFRSFADAEDGAPGDAARAAYYRERDSLGLRLSDLRSGSTYSASWVHLWDFGDEDSILAEIQNLTADSV